MKQTQQRNWSQYNQRLKAHSRIEVFLSADIVDHWYYSGRRKPGGRLRYGAAVIELCLVVREYFGLPLRQTEGFVQSLFDRLGLGLKAPDYTTLSRRQAGLEVRLAPAGRRPGQPLVLAIDSTGLAVLSQDGWNRHKHKKGGGRWQDKWRKLHLAVDTESGLVLSAAYTSSGCHDCTQAEPLLKAIGQDIAAVCADMAYDTVNARRTIGEKGAQERIPPKRNARLARENRNLKPHAEALCERDNAILAIREHRRQGLDASAARALWKQQTGYHRRSLAETAMWRLKAHTSDTLSNRTEPSRKTQAMIKCKVINTLSQIGK